MSKNAIAKEEDSKLNYAKGTVLVATTRDTLNLEVENGSRSCSPAERMQ